MAETINDIRGQKIRELVEEMKLYNNPQELEDMKKIIKKNVPMMMRGYLLAYLYVTRGNTRHASQASAKPAQKRVVPENTVSFYINVGKNNKTNSKELSAFICEKAGLSEDDIVSVAFKQNYSFVYIRSDKSQNVIEAVNGQSFKGRKVKMNFSKEKDEQ